MDPKPIIGKSSYLVILNNPIRLNDPKGDKVRYKDEKDKQNVEKFTTEFVPRTKRDGTIRRNKDGTPRMKRNKNYVASFAKHINDLDSRDEIYEIGYDPNMEGGISGSFSYLGDNVFRISYSKPNDVHGGFKEGVLFEEVFHAVQFTQGKFNFKKVDGVWKAEGLDIYDEIEAKRFAVYALAGTRDYKTSERFNRDGGSFSTIMRVVQGPTEEVVNKLMHGWTESSADIGAQYSDVTTLDHQAVYNSKNTLRNKTPASTKGRTFNSNVVGY